MAFVETNDVARLDSKHAKFLKNYMNLITVIKCKNDRRVVTGNLAVWHPIAREIINHTKNSIESHFLNEKFKKLCMDM